MRWLLLTLKVRHYKVTPQTKITDSILFPEPDIGNEENCRFHQKLFIVPLTEDMYDDAIGGQHKFYLSCASVLNRYEIPVQFVRECR